MFRRIHSNRNPDDTLWKELRGEFGRYLEKAGQRFRTFCSNYPKAIFAGMTALLVVSLILSFTVFRHPAPVVKKKQVARQQPKVLDDGFARILETGAALRQTLTLKQEVETILAKSKLTHRDSLALEGALDSLQQLQHQIQHAP